MNSVTIQIQSQGSSDSISLKSTELQPTAEATPIHKGFVMEKSGARSGFLLDFHLSVSFYPQLLNTCSSFYDITTLP